MSNSQNIQMYKLDLKNVTGLNANAKKLLQDKINLIEKEKESALSTEENKLNKEIGVLQTLLNSGKSTNNLLSKQNNELNNIENKLTNSEINLSTIKRQLQISMDSSIRKNNVLYLLKLIFIYLLLSMIPILLTKNNMLSDKNAFIILSSITLVFMVFIVISMLKLRNRNAIRYDKTNFNNPNIQKVLQNKQGHKHLGNVYSHKPNTININSLITTLENLKQKAIKLEDFITASMCQNMIDQIQQAVAMGDPLGGYKSKAAIQTMIQQIQNEMSLQNKQHHSQTQARIAQLLTGIKLEENKLKTLNSEISQLDTKESKIKSEISNVDNTVKLMQKQLSNLQKGP